MQKCQLFNMLSLPMKIVFVILILLAASYWLFVMRQTPNNQNDSDWLMTKMKPKGASLKFENVQISFSAVTALRYDLDSLIIEVSSKNAKAEVSFENPIGFRVLDEGELLEFWPGFSRQNGWLFEVSAGGWKELEASRAGSVLLKDNPDIREFLITGDDDCVSILAYEEPEVRML